MEDIEIESIGKLKQHPDVPDEWLVSELIQIPFFDRKELAFTLDGDLQNDESFLVDVNQAIEIFLRKDADDRLSFSNAVYKNYKEVQDYYSSEPYVVPQLELSNESEIWKYVYPSEIYICRGFDEDKNIYLQLHCGCEWEKEHGLQLVFKDGLELTRISDIDLNPTE
jgi:hypothetical protein